MKSIPFTIGGITIQPGERKTIELPAASLYTQTPLNIPMHVIHGKKAGPKIFIISAVHGDEINGVEIIHLLLNDKKLNHLKGTLIAIPIANIYGFMTLSRYLPDRRDLNRSFPGSSNGSLAARVANMLMTEVISRCTYGIDLHTGRVHLDNLPHIRTNIAVPGALRLARAFNVPVILDAKLRDGSIRQAAAELKIPVLVYEAGEALRFNDFAIRAGLHGVMKVLERLEMITPHQHKEKIKIMPRLARYNTWLRSPESGIFHSLKTLGDHIKKGEILGRVTDPFSKNEALIKAPIEGIIIGRNTLPLLNAGDALFNIAQFRKSKNIVTQLDELQSELSGNLFPLDEDE